MSNPFPLKVDDRVVRVIDVGTRRQFGSLEGTVRAVYPRRTAGGNLGRVRVLWDNGFEGSLEERQIATVAERDARPA